MKIKVKVRVRCNECGRRFYIKSTDASCPGCNGSDYDVLYDFGQ